MYFNFGTAFFFFLLLLLPCFIWCKVVPKRYYFSQLHWLPKEHGLLVSTLLLKLFLFTLMVFALSKPFVYDAHSLHNKKGRDLVLALDASGSMAESGFDAQDRFKTKFQTNIALATDFIQKRLDDNMGIVIFGTFAYTASPLTYDLSSLSYLLHLSTVGIAGESTAIGDAIQQSIRTLQYGSAKCKAIILLSDGYHNAGSNSPQKAVARAKKLGIKIYTIGIGKASNYDTALLQKIAKETGAKSYAATSASALKAIYTEIQALEPSPIRSEAYLNQKLLIIFPLGLAFILLLVWTFWRQRQDR